MTAMPVCVGHRSQPGAELCRWACRRSAAGSVCGGRASRGSSPRRSPGPRPRSPSTPQVAGPVQEAGEGVADLGVAVLGRCRSGRRRSGAGLPVGLPWTSRRQAARWSAFMSTPITPWASARLDREGGGGRDLPGGGQIPAVPAGIEVDAVGDRPVGRDAVRPLAAPVRERDPARQDVPSVRGVRQMGQRCGQLDAHLAVRADPDRLVAVPLAGLPVRLTEPALRLPTPTPRRTP